MDTKVIAKIYDAAFKVVGCSRLSETCQIGGVGAALLTEKGNIYTGICVDLSSSMGYCAERAAAAEMLKNRESVIKMVVAVDWNGKILPPCGFCREFMLQLNEKNTGTLVVLGKEKVLRLAKLMPFRWKA